MKPGCQASQRKKSLSAVRVEASGGEVVDRSYLLEAEVAARAHLQRLLPVIDEALRRAGIGLADVGCVAVHNTPGLVGALLIGVSAAKMLSLVLGVPLVAGWYLPSPASGIVMSVAGVALPQPAAARAVRRIATRAKRGT